MFHIQLLVSGLTLLLQYRTRVFHLFLLFKGHNGSVTFLNAQDCILPRNELFFAGSHQRLHSTSMFGH